ncbi:hypothetical protein LC087_01275 [Bacillus carboniphilus]|uniref:Uncharacterized protein n=1 Tax=Bacillus carboniphilus TaxID=86663 RepID=A0ABY9JVT6_9BACI|nr:hypothetical protein [Bacillus carboniphilus]WLR42899.1 hypothetical protein LC087_01275 [Bacillus carboniphilus]
MDSESVKNYLFLSMAVKVFHQDREILQLSNLPLKETYVMIINQAIESCQQDLQKVNKKLSRQGIKVVQKKREKSFTLYKCYNRQSEKQFSLNHQTIREEVALIMRKYLQK